MPTGVPFKSEHPLIFTDLDGSLLDHYTYSAAPAKALLEQLEDQGIAVIFVTSKTFPEVVNLREALGNRHPFVVENGAAVYLPEGYFSKQFLSKYQTVDDSASSKQGYQCVAFCQSRCHWQRLLTHVSDDYAGCFKSFTQLGVVGISEATGLTQAQAKLANQREFSEPLQWLGDAETQQDFIAHMEQLGARVLKGGRFLHISGACSKGNALQWLASVSGEPEGAPLRTIAIGDSGNDIAMLEVADQALVIRSPVHQPPSLKRTEKVWLSEAEGPQGWVEGVEAILAAEYPDIKLN